MNAFYVITKNEIGKNILRPYKNYCYGFADQNILKGAVYEVLGSTDHVHCGSYAQPNVVVSLELLI